MGLGLYLEVLFYEFSQIAVLDVSYEIRGCIVWRGSFVINSMIEG